MSQAGVVPGPNASMKMGPPQATRGHPRSRYAQVRQRKRNLEQDRRHKKPSSPRKKQGEEKQQQNSLNILQVNIAGISKKKIEIAHLLSEKEVHVALVQESQHQNADPYISGYTHTTCNHSTCRGILTYIRNDITATVEQIESDNPTDFHKITLWFSGSKYIIYNVYNPPWNHLNFETFTEPIYHKTIIAGDLNGHSPEWGYSDYNPTGISIEELCESTNLTVLQDKNSPPTLLFKVNKKGYRPDLTILSSDLLNRHTIKVLDSVDSDHRPILTSILEKKKKSYRRRTKWNFKKADWIKYNEILEPKLKDILEEDYSVDSLSEDISKAILEAAAQSIPKGCRNKFKPFWTDEIQEAVNLREKARKKLEQDQSDTSKIEYNRCCAKVKLTIKDAKRRKWTETTGELDLTRDGAKAWSLLNNLNGDNRRDNPKPMYLDNECIVESQKKAEKMNAHFASISKASMLTEKDKADLKELKAKEKAPSASQAIFEEEFTMTELNRAMKKLKQRKSPGPDKLHNEMLVKLGPTGRKAILCLINLSWRKGTIPQNWKNAILSPILKKNKPAEDLNSYRPISISSCLGKISERMVNNRLTWWLETTGYLHANQAGFRAGHRTEDQLFRLSQKVIDGFQKKHHTTAVFVDLKQAYDRVWRKGLCQKMITTGIHGKLYKWLKTFLSDRTIQTRINDGLSSKAVLEEGLPQGSPLSCTLFLIYINDLPEILKTQNALYADDLAIWHTSKFSLINKRRLNEDLESLSKYCERWKMTINTSKTVYCIFSLSHKISKLTPSITLNGKQLQKEDNPTYLGITFDERLTLNEHMDKIKHKAKSRLRLVKRLASTSWGADKNTLRQLYLGYVRSTMEYSLALQAISSKSNQLALDKVQNNALRFISGGLKSTPTAACEVHTNVEPMNIRRDAAVVETVERYRRQVPNNPNRIITEKDPPIQRIKKRSILSVAESLRDSYKLPENREEISLFDINDKPYTQLLTPQIKQNLIDGCSKKNEDELSLKLTALQTIDKYSDDWIHVYTDGSATGGTSNAGYGARIQYPNQQCREIFDSIGKHKSNFEAEATAVNESLKLINTYFNEHEVSKTNIVIFSDALSVLQAVESENNKRPIIRKMMTNISEMINVHGVDIFIQWIPSHVNIPGNERADTLAKQGAKCPQDDTCASMDTAKQIIKRTKREIWMKEWSESDKGRAIFEHMSTPMKNDEINALKRQEQVNIFRLRSKHVPLNAHLKRIGVLTSSECPLCQVPEETVEHHLFLCPALDDLRTELLPPKPDISNTLFGTSLQLKNTNNFYVMAGQRRAKAHLTGSDK